MKEPICCCGHLKRDHDPIWCKFFGDGCWCKSFTDKRISARRAASKSTREAGPKKAIIDLLEKRGIRWFRMQAGDIIQQLGGRRQRIKGNPAGTPDFLCFINAPIGSAIDSYWILWIEAKSNSGKLRPEQVEFQNSCERTCETYLVARSKEDVERWLDANL